MIAKQSQCHVTISLKDMVIVTHAFIIYGNMYPSSSMLTRIPYPTSMW